MLAALLAVAIGAGLTVWMDALDHAIASGAHPSASGFATQDLGGSQARATGGRISLYLITEDDDEYASLPCRLLTAYMAGS